MAGIDDEQLVDEAVAIPVVEAPVDVTLLEHVYDVLDQILRVLIVLIGTSVLLGVAADLHIHQVEDDVEVTIALGQEIVVDGTLKRSFRQVLSIENLIPLLHRGCLVANERHDRSHHRAFYLQRYHAAGL